VIIDGLPVELGMPSTAVIKGDRSVAAVAAASIVAKVARDALMVELDAEYPGYGLAHNKGYGSRDHLECLAEHGPTGVHRRSFAPCSQTLLF
jgi:ribonuclease HII